MKKTRIFVGLAALALAIGGFLTTKANKKFSETVEFNGSVFNGKTFTGTFTTVAANGSSVFIKTSAGTKLATLRTGTSGSAKAYFY